MRIQLLVLALILPAFIGCLGGDDGGSAGETVTKARAQVTDQLGGIEGTVTDPAIQPVEGATVHLVELHRNTTTASDGSFAFSELEPATYTLEVRAEGFISKSQTVQVTAGEVSIVDFLISQKFTEDPFTQQLELNGFFECGGAAGYDLSPLPAPANVSGGIITISACSFVNLNGGNVTNDKFSHVVELEAPLRTVVVETTWQPSTGSLSDQLWVSVDPEGFPCGSIDPCNQTMLDHWGQSPLVGRIDHERLQEVQTYFNEQCEQGNDEYCGYSFFDGGWDLLLRVFPRWECQPAGVQGCVLVQQPFTHLVSGFYNAPAPEGYSVTGS